MHSNKIQKIKNTSLLILSCTSFPSKLVLVFIIERISQNASSYSNLHSFLRKQHIICMKCKTLSFQEKFVFKSKNCRKVYLPRVQETVKQIQINNLHDFQRGIKCSQQPGKRLYPKKCVFIKKLHLLKINSKLKIILLLFYY